MKEFIEAIKADPKLQKEFNEYILGADSKVREGSKQVGEQLNKVVIDTYLGFAKEHNIPIKDDPAEQEYFKSFSKQVCMQLDEMIMKQFKLMSINQTKGKIVK